MANPPRPRNKDLARPECLTDAGIRAWECIVRFLQKKRMLYTGGCPAFKNPATWAEEFGRESILVVVHDGGCLAPIFNWDYDQEKLVEEMRQWLGKHGFWAEQCTSWYSAIYAQRKPENN